MLLSYKNIYCYDTIRLFAKKFVGGDRPLVPSLATRLKEIHVFLLIFTLLKFYAIFSLLVSFFYEISLEKMQYSWAINTNGECTIGFSARNLKIVIQVQKQLWSIHRSHAPKPSKTVTRSLWPRSVWQILERVDGLQKLERRTCASSSGDIYFIDFIETQCSQSWKRSLISPRGNRIIIRLSRLRITSFARKLGNSMLTWYTKWPQIFHIIWRDEAVFHVGGLLNCYNSHYWAEKDSMVFAVDSWSLPLDS